MISSSAQFPGPDVDECTFPGPDALTSEFPGVDFAVVAFPPAPMPVIEGVAHFTGVGYLTVDIFGIAKVAALFSGSGSATADSIAWGGVKQATAIFTGSGDFAVLARAVQRAAYSGSGSLAAKIATALAATLSGSGQAAFTSSAIGIAPFTLNGEGTAAATVVAVGGAYSVSANFTGEGIATAKVVPSVSAGFTGSGSASAAVASAIKSVFTGTGSLATKAIASPKANFTGSGVASASIVPVFSQVSMTKNGDQQLAASTWAEVASWTAGSNSTVTGNALRVNGSGNATIQVGSEWPTSTSVKDWRVLKNGTVVWTKGSGTGLTLADTFALAVVDGDLLTCEGWNSSGVTANRIVKTGANTYLRVVPA